MAETFKALQEPTGKQMPSVGARRLLLTALVIGLLVDLSLQTRVDGAAAATTVLLIVGVFLGIREVTSRSGRVLMVASLLPAAFLFISSSAWVIAPSLAAVVFLLALGTALAREGSVLDLGFVGALHQSARLLTNALTAPLYLGSVTSLVFKSDDPDHPARTTNVLRGMSIAVPLAVVLGLLLASADAVFASLIRVPISASSVLAHLLLVLFGACIATGLFVQSAPGGITRDGARRLRLGSVEGVVVLSALIAVYGLFAFTRVLVAQQGPEYVLEETGLTYAAYARSGFFQLLWAAGLTLVVLLGLRSIVDHATERSRRIQDALSIVAVALTLVVVQTAVARLNLYEDAFGLTMLRLYSSVFAWWIALVFVLLGLALVIYQKRNWLPAAVMSSAVLGLIVLNAVNPERVVIEHNAERAAQGEDFDVRYALGLSDDSVPALLNALPDLKPADRRLVLDNLCHTRRGDDPTKWNLSAIRAEAAVDEACSDR